LTGSKKRHELENRKERYTTTSELGKKEGRQKVDAVGQYDVKGEDEEANISIKKKRTGVRVELGEC